MKIAIIWKWWAWKTTISVLVLQALAKQNKVLAIDCDSNKNLIDYLWFEKNKNIFELWDLKKEVFDLSKVSSSEYDRKYFPTNWIWVFNTNDELYKKVAYIKDNLSLIELWSPKEKRVWVTWMCPYNETIKVYLSNLIEKEKEIVWCDFAAWSEVAWKWIVASFDNVIIPIEPNSKNLDVAKDIYKTLKLINFENIYFIANKISNYEDIDFINSYFWEKLNFIWEIPFSKEIMKADINWNLCFDNISQDLKNNIENIVNNIKNLTSDRKKALDRITALDILKWDKKCH